MSGDCKRNEIKFGNNEIVICNYLFSNYLNNDEMMQRIGLEDYIFIPETPENYVDSKPVGRVDFQVFSTDRFRHRNRYFIIECKRLDGGSDLNRKYIDKGIRRFVDIPPKYTSHFKMNCMLGIAVKTFDFEENINNINYLLEKEYPDIHVHTYLTNWHYLNIFFSLHGNNESERIILLHAVTDCSSYVE